MINFVFFSSLFFSKVENEIINEENNSYHDDDQDDSLINEFDDAIDYRSVPTIESSRQLRKTKKSKSSETKLDPLIPLLTQIAAKRKQINKNRKDDQKQTPNLNFQTQGWR